MGILGGIEAIEIWIHLLNKVYSIPVKGWEQLAEKYRTFVNKN